MKYHFHFLTIAFCLSVLAACTRSAGETGGGEAAAPPRQVRTQPAEPVVYRETVYASGRLAAKEEARLSFKTGGIIRKIYVREGERVRRGQLLAELELDEIRAQQQQAELRKEQAAISVENARLALKLAERDYRNTRGLYQDSVATLEQLEDAEVQLDNARNQLEAAKMEAKVSKQNLNVAEFNFKYSRINAPANGLILRRLAEPNELVGAGTPILLFGSSDKLQVIQVNIPDKDIIHVQLGDSATVEFDAYPNRAFRGIVREMAGMADPATGTYALEIEVLPDGANLLSGFIGSVRIRTRRQQQLTRIPVDALFGANQNRGAVFVLQDGRAHKKTVNIYRMEGESLLIREGLAPGEPVIVTAVGYLQDEQPVSVMAEEDEEQGS